MSIKVHMGSDYVQFGPFDSRNLYLKENASPDFYLVAGPTIIGFRGPSGGPSFAWSFKIAGYKVADEFLDATKHPYPTPTYPTNTAVAVSY